MDVEVETSDDQPNNHISTNTLATPSGLQQIEVEDDNNDISLPMDMADAISNSAEGRVEQTDDEIQMIMMERRDSYII